MLSEAGLSYTIAYDPVRLAPASSRTAGAPTAISEATLPCASTSTADGVPLAPKARPTANCWSKSTGEARPISLFASSEPVETTSNLGASSAEFSSHSFSSGSICWQKSHPGFQKSTRVSSPLKSASSTVLPSRSGSLTSGASSPTFWAAGTVGAAAWTLPQLGQGCPSVWGCWGCIGSWARSPTAYERRPLMPSAPPATGLATFPSGEEVRDDPHSDNRRGRNRCSVAPTAPPLKARVRAFGLRPLYCPWPRLLDTPPGARPSFCALFV